MLWATTELFTDSLLLAGVLRSLDDARIKNTTLPLLLPFLNSKFFQDDSHGTEFGESELEKIQADESRKNKPICALKNWTGLYA